MQSGFHTLYELALRCRLALRRVGNLGKILSSPGEFQERAAVLFCPYSQCWRQKRGSPEGRGSGWHNIVSTTDAHQVIEVEA
jgi:hypothetical protein